MLSGMWDAPPVLRSPARAHGALLRPVAAARTIRAVTAASSGHRASRRLGSRFSPSVHRLAGARACDFADGPSSRTTWTASAARCGRQDDSHIRAAQHLLRPAEGFGQPLQPPSNAAERRARCLAGARAAPRPQPRSVPRLACRSRRRATANSAPWRSAGCACTLAILCTSPDPIPEQACEGVGGSRATRWPLRAAGHVACCCCARGERCAGEVAAADAHGHARSPYSPSIAGWPRCCRGLCCLLWLPSWSVGRRVARRVRRWACVRWIARAACTVWDCATHARAGARCRSRCCQS